ERVVPLPEQLPGRRQAGVAQRIAVVAADHPRAHARQIGRTPDAVAAAFRNDAERWAADFDFAEAAGGRRDHFLRVRDVGDIGRDAAAAESRARIQAVHLHAAFVAA